MDTDNYKAYEVLRNAFDHIGDSDWRRSVKTSARTKIVSLMLDVAQDRLKYESTLPQQRNIWEDFEFSQRHTE